MALYGESNVLFSAYLGFHWKDFPKNSHLAISTHELQKT